MSFVIFRPRCLRNYGLQIRMKSLLLTLGASVMFTLTVNHVLYSSPSAVSRLGPSLMLMNKVGNSHLDYFEEFAELSDEEKIGLMNKMTESTKYLMQICATRKAVCKGVSEQKYILTLFTTWVYDKEKFPINNKTLYNWRLLPNVKLVVFTNSTEVKYFSELAGFHVLPVTEEASGAPVLPTMFGAVMKKFQSEFYGYANGDILFTNTLVDTLKHVQCNLAISKRQNGILIVGRRVNIPSSSVTDEIAKSWEKLDRISHSGSLFQSNAEDYFITDKLYPWHKFLPVAVGRRAYDNWVVAFSRYHNLTVIDASESIQCLHQTLESRGNFEGLHKGRYNIELIDQLKLPFNFKNWGRTFCTGMKLWTNLCGEVVLSERYKLDSKCTSFYTFHTLYEMLGLRVYGTLP